MTKRPPVQPKPKKEEQSVLEMSAVQAKTFFLKPQSYCSLELPPYFRFDKILSGVANVLGGGALASMSSKPRQHEGVNYSLLSNKDGRYAWRQFQLIHPALYVSLIDQITAPDKWAFILNCFNEFHKLKNSTCLSIPVQSLSKRKDMAAQIIQWWQGIEQQSIELAMEYEYVFHADITDCYSSIYTHSIVWALHTKPVAKDKRNDKALIGNVIDGYIQDMRHGQTNGIPQGSVLMDFIAEMVLGYADLLLSDKLKQERINDYRILRYRDDYRVFVNSPQTGEAILKALTEVLIELGLKLNTSKTTAAQPVIVSSLKPDKLAWLRNRQEDSNLQKHLLIIHMHGLDFPNAGSLVAGLTQYLELLHRKKYIQSPRALISIAVDIAYRSPRTFPVCAAIVSHLLRFLESDAERAEVLQMVHGKLSKLPNTGLIEVWLQRIGDCYKFRPNYKEKLCRLVAGQRIELWNNDWIENAALKDAIQTSKIFDGHKFRAITRVVRLSEVEMFVRLDY